jgi:hypothetical protein
VNIQLRSEDALTLDEVARIEGVAHSTAHLWCVKGVRGVRLESYRRGVRYVTSRQALDRFRAALDAKTCVAS